MDTATEISKLTIDPDGDVVLVLDSTELQVSSKVLSVASSVFKAMFGPHFQEGQDLSATSPKRISLPEDNTAAMSILCNIFHHQSHNVNKGPNPSTLAEIGTLCDKYNCSEALQSWIRTWLGYYQRDMSSTELEMVGVTNLLYPFYVFNHPESFKQISIMTVYCAKGFINKPLIGGSLPDGVLELLQRKKWEIERKLSLDLATMVEPLLDCQQDHTFLSSIGDGQKLWRHLRELRRLGLWPVSSAFTSSSISTVCKWFEAYEHKTIGDDTCLAAAPILNGW